MSELSLRREIAAVCRRIYDHGFVAATDGNVTARLDSRRILATPSGVSTTSDVLRGALICGRPTPGRRSAPPVRRIRRRS